MSNVTLVPIRMFIDKFSYFFGEPRCKSRTLVSSPPERRLPISFIGEIMQLIDAMLISKLTKTITYLRNRSFVSHHSLPIGDAALMGNTRCLKISASNGEFRHQDAECV
ncbi:hypothetical protein RZN05_18615 [Sphingomonas sp. HF-S4]|uniref:Uncharacterized protein n=1 Tax=Sphingomonas agrestis TaxID=3080540 RepID=A0ABU3YCA9_9SPHN|nr:hypothetical protein [Sphingomonas sp. HF-S4]MDV3459018.1 hypothetical protein [Sphingomonas sp. HF-S4]